MSKKDKNDILFIIILVIAGLFIIPQYFRKPITHITTDIYYPDAKDYLEKHGVVEQKEFLGLDPQNEIAYGYFVTKDTAIILFVNNDSNKIVRIVRHEGFKDPYSGGTNWFEIQEFKI